MAKEDTLHFIINVHPKTKFTLQWCVDKFDGLWQKCSKIILDFDFGDKTQKYN